MIDLNDIRNMQENADYWDEKQKCGFVHADSYRFTPGCKTPGSALIVKNNMLFVKRFKAFKTFNAYFLTVKIMWHDSRKMWPKKKILVQWIEIVTRR